MLLHTVLEVRVAGIARYSLSLQADADSQVRSEVEVGATVSYCPTEHTVTGAQTRFDEGVGAAFSYCEEVHVVIGRHTLSLLSVAAWASYCAFGVQTVRFAQERSEVAVGALIMYCDAVQLLSGAHSVSVDAEQGVLMNSFDLHGTHPEHTRSEVKVHGDDWTLLAGQTVQLLQTRLLVFVGACDWYSRLEHTVVVLQMRSEVRVGGATWNCEELQVVAGLHAVWPATFWKLVTPSQAAQTRFEVTVGEVLSNSPALHVVVVRQNVCPLFG